MVGKGQVFIKDKAKVANRVSGVKCGVVYLVKLLFESNEYELVLKELTGDWQSSRKRFDEGNFVGG